MTEIPDTIITKATATLPDANTAEHDQVRVKIVTNKRIEDGQLKMRLYEVDFDRVVSDQHDDNQTFEWKHKN